MGLAVVAPAEHTVLVFLCQVLVLLVVAKGFGALLAKLGQPSVVGELLAGVALGPSLFGRVADDAQTWLFPEDAVQGAMLSGLAWMGLLLLLASTGFESDLTVIRRLGRPAVFVTLGSLLVPLVGGSLVGLVAPEDLLGDSATRLGFAAFLAVALSISSLPVVAKVLAELGLVRRNVGQLILAVAIANDVVGWILLGVVAGLAESNEFDVGDLALTIVGVVVFLAAALTIGQRAIDRLLWVVASSSPSNAPAVAVIAVVVGAGALTQWMGVEAVLGAFIAGLLIGRSTWRDERALHLVDSIAHGLLAPLFFATAGLRIDLAVFTDRTVAVWSVVIIAVASATKFVGAIGGARFGRLPRREGLALGVALNARGALEIVIASIGLGLGVLNDASYGVIVVMAIATSISAPPLLRAVLSGWPGTEAEQQRLAAEEAARAQVIPAGRPPMMLSRGRPPSIAAAQLIDVCWPAHAPVTVVTTVDDARLAPVRGVLHDRRLRVIHREGDVDVAKVLAEAGKGHSAVVLGLTDEPGSPLLSPLVETILAKANTPVVLIRGERMSGRSLPGAFARAVVPVSGSLNSRAAQELASAMSARLGTELLLLYLDASPDLYGSAASARTAELSEQMLARATDVALAVGARPAASISRRADSVAGELGRVVVEFEADVVVIGSTPRSTGEGAHLGPVATHLLETCPATVVVVATPSGWSGHTANG